MFEEARQRSEKYVVDESNRRAEARRPISPTLQKMLNEVNEPHDSKQPCVCLCVCMCVCVCAR